MKIAVFPGSFDPFTLAHKDLVDRSLGLFDKIVIAIGINTSKKGLMDVELRKKAITEVYQGNQQVEVVTFSGLTVDYCTQLGAGFILRGLRNGADLLYEDAIAQNNLLLEPGIETFFLVSKSDKSFISSTIVREIFLNNGRVGHLVPPPILNALDTLKNTSV